MKVGDTAPAEPSEYPRKFREVFVLAPTEAAEGMQPKVCNRVRARVVLTTTC